MTITVVFDPPLPSDSPATFNTKAFSTLGDLNDWSTEANALATTVNSDASTASTGASTATTQAGIATTKASEASASALAADASADAAAASAASVVAIEVTTHAATSKTTPVDADEIPMSDSAASWGLKKLTWANLKATAKTYFDTLYQAVGTYVTPTTLNNGTLPASVTTLAASGNATLGDAEATDTHAVKGATTVLADSASPALKVTQTGAGNAFVVEDAASDTTPFVIDADGRTYIGSTTGYGITGLTFPLLSVAASEANQSINTWNSGIAQISSGVQLNRSKSNTFGTYTAVASNDWLGSVRFGGADGTNFVRAAEIFAAVDGTPGANDMPGRLVFSTTPDGGSVPTERMRIDSSGNVLVTNAAGLGYGTGAGGTVTQATSKSTAVTLNKPTGQITMNGASLAAGATVTFLVSNILLTNASDQVFVSLWAGNSNYVLYSVRAAAGVGGFYITLKNEHTAPLADAVVLNVAIIKGATS